MHIQHTPTLYVTLIIENLFLLCRLLVSKVPTLVDRSNEILENEVIRGVKWNKFENIPPKIHQQWFFFNKLPKFKEQVSRVDGDLKKYAFQKSRLKGVPFEMQP